MAHKKKRTFFNTDFEAFLSGKPREPRLRLIGDTHSKWSLYARLVMEAPGPTLHMGDLASDGYLPLKSIDPISNRVLLGNHDTYPEVPDYPHFLDDYGAFHVTNSETGAEEIAFYVRGAWSRKRNRISGCYEDEEIPESKHEEILEAYKNTKPQWIFTHDCPQFIAELQHGENVFETTTGALLQRLFEAHEPRYWYFAHHHHIWSHLHENRVGFICVPRDCFLDIPLFTCFKNALIAR